MYRAGIWHTGEELCDSLKAGEQVDILFLDIVLLHMSGVEAGSFIRDYLEGRKIQIVYISEHPSYAMELFLVIHKSYIVNRGRVSRYTYE